MDGDVNVHKTECGVCESSFPKLKNCCDRAASFSAEALEVVCQECKIWTSLPSGDDLVVAHVVECLKYGYVRRIRD